MGIEEGSDLKQTSESKNQSGTLWNFPSETGDCSDSPKG